MIVLLMTLMIGADAPSGSFYLAAVEVLLEAFLIASLVGALGA